MGVLRRFSATPAPRSWLFAIGLVIAAVAPSPPVAGVGGTVLLHPLLLLAGLWVPLQKLAPVWQHIGNYTPLNAAVSALVAAMQGHFPPAQPLLVLAGYAAVFGIAAIWLFRWE
jgi:ABC-2 type transport system permease protein